MDKENIKNSNGQMPPKVGSEKIKFKGGGLKSLIGIRNRPVKLKPMQQLPPIPKYQRKPDLDELKRIIKDFAPLSGEEYFRTESISTKITSNESK
jgi:hypothetical protein